MSPYGPEPVRIKEKSLAEMGASERKIVVLITELREEQGGTYKLALNKSKPIRKETGP